MSHLLPLALLAALVALVTIGLLAGGSDADCDGYAFPRADWRAATSGGGTLSDDERAKAIARAARACGALTGLTTARARALLGPPDEQARAGTEDRWKWGVGKSRQFLLRSESLEIVFERGRSVAATSP